VKKLATAIASIAILLLVWHFAARRVNSAVFPNPSLVLEELVRSRALLARASLSTLADALLGLGAGLSVAVLLRAVYQVVPMAKSFSAPLLLVSQLTPKIVIFPLLTILLSSFAAKLFVVAAFSLFPLLDSFSLAERETPKPLIEQLRLMGAGRWQIFWKFEVRHIFPFLMSSLKVGFVFSFMGAMTVEFYKPSGLGKVINEGFGDAMAYSVGWAGIVCSTLSGMIGWFSLNFFDSIILRKYYPHKHYAE
jgi:ABC-type nitrate/sulfonate/bicarbonate transport system permease component